MLSGDLGRWVAIARKQGNKKSTVFSLDVSGQTEEFAAVVSHDIIISNSLDEAGSKTSCLHFRHREFWCVCAEAPWVGNSQKTMVLD